MNNLLQSLTLAAGQDATESGSLHGNGTLLGAILSSDWPAGERAKARRNRARHPKDWREKERTRCQTNKQINKHIKPDHYCPALFKAGSVSLLTSISYTKYDFYPLLMLF